MSTRANFIIEQQGMNNPSPIQLYHHMDGYPTGMLPYIKEAWEKSGKGWQAGRSGKVASMICATDPAGFEPEGKIGLHGDIEYLYKITVINTSGGSLAEKPRWLVQIFTSHGLPKTKWKKFWDTGDPKLLKKTGECYADEIDEKISAAIEEKG